MAGPVNSQAARILSIPCCWENCDHSFDFLNGLSTHVSKFHRVSPHDFGCSECGLIAADSAAIQRHQKEAHGKASKPIKARKAFVQYCRSQLIKSRPWLTTMPLRDWWQRGSGKYDRKAGKRTGALGRYTRVTGQRTRYKRDPDTTDHCPKCNISITPWTSKTLLDHFSKVHSVTIVLDFEKLGSFPKFSFKSASYKAIHGNEGVHEGLDLDDWNDISTSDGLQDDSDTEECDESDLDEDDLEEDDPDEGDDSHDGGGLRDKHSIDEGDSSRHEATQTPTIPTFTQPPLTATHSTFNDAEMKKTLMSCFKDEELSKIEQVFAAYCTRKYTDKSYLVDKNLPQDVELDPCEVEHATLTPGGWHCQILHCGLTVPDRFRMALHLHAHKTLGGWYCSDLSCQSGVYEKAFESREGLDKHIMEVHQDSDYSRAAARPFSKQDIFTLSLLNVLKIRTHHEPAVITDPPESNLVHKLKLDASQPEYILMRALELAVTQQTKEPHNVDFSLTEEIRAWHEYGQSIRIDSQLVTSGEIHCNTSGDDNVRYNADLETLFANHSKGNFVFLCKSLRPRLSRLTLPSQMYWVDMLTGVDNMDKRDAMRYVLSYRHFCNSVSLDVAENFLVGLKALTDGGAKKQETIPREKSPACESSFCCPWPGCGYKRSRAYEICRHFVDIHMDCVWQCPEEGCEHCGYRSLHRRERHRMACHVGTPLQCGHEGCEQTFLHHSSSRGHTSWPRLRLHYERVLNQSLESLLPVKQHVPQNTELRQTLPSQSSYEQKFKGGSIEFLSTTRRRHRKASNYSLFGSYQFGMEQAQVDIRGHKNCTGFFMYGRHFKCVDFVYLQVDTAMLLFVPSLMLFTVAPTCDYCIHIMSLISRCYAQIPHPFTFSPANAHKTRKRQGIGSDVDDHTAFMKLVSKNPLSLPPMALKFREIQKNPKHIFIVDFESLMITKKGLPLIPTEVTFRYGDGSEIISCVINEKGVTNNAFENKMKALGFTDKCSFDGARRIRGEPGDLPPPNSKTPRQIIRGIVRAGLSPKAYWIKYSSNAFNYRCMLELIKIAGKDPQAILPPPSQCWTVLPDFSRALPGLRSYQLGKVAKLMNPTNPDLNRLHHSNEDTAVLYDILDRWFHR